MEITLGSLFDGIGGWQLAAIRARIKPLWSSEIESFPCSITAKHFPETVQLGDITLLDGANLSPVDIITMGSPCQDLSIAGKREGLQGERSGLFKAAVNIIRAMRRATHGKFPQIVVWENVTGAFSSHKGADFRAVLEKITEATIPMPESGRWAAAGMVRSHGCDCAWRVLDAQYWGVPQRRKRIFLVTDFRGECAGEILFKPESLSGDATESGGERQRTAGGTENSIISTGARNHTLAEPSLWDMTHASEVMRPIKIGVAPTLNAHMGTGGNQVPVMLEPYCIGNGQIHQSLSNKAGTLNCMHDQQAILTRNKFARRLMPIECERLQGLPDNWTAGGSDSARYKAIGNGMAQPCADFVLKQIMRVLK